MGTPTGGIPTGTESRTSVAVIVVSVVVVVVAAVLLVLITIAIVALFRHRMLSEQLWRFMTLADLFVLTEQPNIRLSNIEQSNIDIEAIKFRWALRISRSEIPNWVLLSIFIVLSKRVWMQMHPLHHPRWSKAAKYAVTRVMVACLWLYISLQRIASDGDQAIITDQQHRGVAETKADALTRSSPPSSPSMLEQGSEVCWCESDGCMSMTMYFTTVDRKWWGHHYRWTASWSNRVHSRYI